MRRRSLTLRAALLAVAVAGFGCVERAETPMAPAAPADLHLQASPVVLQMPQAISLLDRTVPLREDLTASARVGQRGGALRIPEAGLTVFFAAGAVPRSTTITATAVAGRLVAYEFEPHGLRFEAPVWVVQEIGGTGFAGSSFQLLGAQAGYFPNREALDHDTGRARVTELLPVGPWGRGSVAFQIRHFSGYALSSGRSRAF